jgi:hypothetical protein
MRRLSLYHGCKDKSMKGKLLQNYFLLQIITIIVIVLSASRLFSAEAIDLKNSDNGEYIGKYVEYLNEKELFESIKHNWKIEPEYINKILSGNLHSDDNINLKIENTFFGFKAILKQNIKGAEERYAEWGIYDILKEEVSSGFIQSDRSILLLNFNPHAFWLRFKLLNKEDKESDYLLEFIPAGNGFIRKHGDFTQTMEEREVKYKNLVYGLHVKPGFNTYYLRLDSDLWLDNVPLRLWSKENFSNHLYNDNLFQGIILGIFILLFLYNLFIFISIREMCFVYLSLLIVSQLVINLCYSGFGFQYLWSGKPEAGVFIIFLALPLHYAFNLLFCRSFIGTGKYAPKTDTLIRVLIYLFIFMGIAALLIPHSVKTKIYTVIICLD